MKLSTSKSRHSPGKAVCLLAVIVSSFNSSALAAPQLRIAENGPSNLFNGALPLRNGDIKQGEGYLGAVGVAGGPRSWVSSSLPISAIAPGRRQSSEQAIFPGRSPADTIESDSAGNVAFGNLLGGKSIRAAPNVIPGLLGGIAENSGGVMKRNFVKASDDEVTSFNPDMLELNRYLIDHGYPSISHIQRADVNALPPRDEGSSIEDYFHKVVEYVVYTNVPDHIKESFLMPPVTQPPVNEYLAQSAWPAPHRTGYGQGSSPLPGPDGTHELTTEFFKEGLVCNNPINLLYTNDERYIWGSSWTSVFKVDRSQSKMRLVDYVLKPGNAILSDKFHGAYSVLTRDDKFIVGTGDKLDAYHDVPGSNGETIVKHPKPYDMSDDVGSTDDKEVIRALCVTYDGYLVWVTNQGRVGILDHDLEKGFQTSADWMKLGGEDQIDVSNNIACDEDGGIYIVSSKLMHKVNWDGSKLSLAWEAEYGSGGEALSVRLGEGSGSTPSLMGDKKQGRYVVITDGSSVMNVVILDADTGVVRATHPITFGDDNTKLSISEQSILVHGWRLVVVNNTPRKDLINGPPLLGSTSMLLGGDGAEIGETIRSAWPVIVGDAPKGAEQLMFDPNSGKLETTWVNSAVSIPNGIPTMSMEKGIMYGVGKRGTFGTSAGAYYGMWTLEALDWWTGEPKFHFTLGYGPLVNSIYAATQVGPNEEIITGAAAGIVRVRKAGERFSLFPQLTSSIIPPLASMA